MYQTTNESEGRVCVCAVRAGRAHAGRVRGSMSQGRAINALIGADGAAAESFFAVTTPARPPELFGHSAVLDPSGRMVVFGGASADGRFSTDVWVLNLETRNWSSQPVGADGPSGRHFHSCVLHDRTLWVFGGSSNGIYHDLYRLNIDTGRWSGALAALGAVPSPRYGHTAVIYGDSMFVYGGYDQMGFACNDLYELSLATLTWHKPTTSGAVPKEAYHHTAVVFQGSMYTFGGYRKTYNEIQEYRFATKSWSFVHTTGHAPIPRWGHTAVVACDQYMIVFGGRDRVANFQDVHSFCFETRLWRRIDCEGIEGRFFCSAVVSDAWMYVFGGRNIHSFSFNDTLRYGVKDVRDESMVDDLRQLVGDAELADVVFVMPDDVSDGGADLLRDGESTTTTTAATSVSLPVISHDSVGGNAAATPQQPLLQLPPHLISCKRIYAHRNIVCKRCPALAAMLSSSMLEGRTGVVTMRETLAPVMQALLLYLYTDAVLVSSVEHLSGLLSLANQWQLPHLKHQCQLRLVRCVNLHNAIVLLQFANQLDATLLYDASRAFVSKNLSLLPPGEWDTLPPGLATAVKYAASPVTSKKK